MADVKILSDGVLTPALTFVRTLNKAKIVTSADAVLVDNITLDAANFGAVGDGSSGGRKVQCLASSASDMKAISVSTGGEAKKIQLLLSSAIHVVATMGAAVTLASADQVNLGTFSITLSDPT